MKESQEILLKVKTSQNKLETDVLKLKEQEEKLISKLNNLINHQNDSILQLNSHFNQLADSTSTQYYKVTDLINDYSQYITKLENNIQNNIIDNLQKLRLDYLKVLKDFEQNLNSPEEKERINKDILLVKYNEMNEMYKEFKEKEINIIQEYLNIVPKELMNKCDEIIENEQIYDQIYKHFYLKKIEVGQYREGILELKRVEEDYNQYKKKITDNELEMAYSSIINKYENNLKPFLKNKFEQKFKLMKLDFLGNYFHNSDFSLAENNAFLQGSYTLKTREFLSKLRFIMHKFNKDDPKLSVNTGTENIIKSENIELLSDKENKSENFPSFLKNDFFLSEDQKKNFKENIFNNYLNIGKFSKKFEDNFIKTLSENVLGNKIENFAKDSKNSKLVNNFMTKNDLLKHFKDNKKNIIFELFFNYDTFENKEKSENLLLRFFVSEFLSKFGDCWMKYFNPNFSITYISNKDFLNQFKAMNYIIYHINNENYSKAYACYEYVHKNNKNINKVKDSLEILGKNQVFCDVLEYHIEGSQNILDGTKYQKI